MRCGVGTPKAEEVVGGIPKNMMSSKENIDLVMRNFNAGANADGDS